VEIGNVKRRNRGAGYLPEGVISSDNYSGAWQATRS
jgi:hypothetical protein